MHCVCFRPPTSQSFIGQYATQVVTFPRLDHPPQRHLTSGVYVLLLINRMLQLNY